jgi:hypothetical protein
MLFPNNKPLDWFFAFSDGEELPIKSKLPSVDDVEAGGNDCRGKSGSGQSATFGRYVEGTHDTHRTCQ